MIQQAILPRALDHLVLPTAELANVRARLAALGFIVAPEGVHPFGTKNACVYFADGTFIEPLAIGDAAVAEQAGEGGNSFVLGDRTFRVAHGDEGLSAVVFSTNSADADHAEFTGLGVSGGDMVEFSRPALDANGRADTATFRLAFASEGSPGAFFFTCERRKVPAIDRSALECHDNTATRIVGVEAVSGDAETFAGFFATISRGEAERIGSDFKVGLANAVLRVLHDPAAAGTRLISVTFGVRVLGETAALFKTNGIGYQTRGNALHVAATAGQGADFVFEEIS